MQYTTNSICDKGRHRTRQYEKWWRRAGRLDSLRARLPLFSSLVFLSSILFHSLSFSASSFPALLLSLLCSPAPAPVLPLQLCWRPNVRLSPIMADPAGFPIQQRPLPPIQEHTPISAPMHPVSPTASMPALTEAAAIGLGFQEPESLAPSQSHVPATAQAGLQYCALASITSTDSGMKELSCVCAQTGWIARDQPMS